ncbi:GNAT family N-acetyltransferase [Nocardioides sp. JQ2195]|uniref:GNAT family N-acetyltransferase n=1 Tax=Nocardioides sp. JQ2195 TaxID=2592334 RepID=UPI001F110735|nr:GNAT family N-acetyltransferase [Nocardioides sp. JQ2195]
MSAAATVARTLDEVESLRPIWTSLPVPNIDAHIDYYLAVVRSSPQVLRPHVIHLPREHGDLLVVARLVDQSFPLRLGYRTLGTIRARTLLVSFDGILGVETTEDRRVALDLLREQLRAGEADVLVLQKVEDGCALDLEFRATSSPLWQTTTPSVVRHRLTVPNSLYELLESRPSRSRKRLRREMKLFDRDFKGRWSLKRIDAGGGTDQLTQDIDAVAAHSYQRHLGIGSVDEQVLHALRDLALDRGWLRAWILYMDAAPVAFWWGMLHEGILEPGATGFDPALRSSGVGFFTLMKMLEDTCLDPDVKTVDFGYGEADYKRRFASESSLHSDLLVFAAKPRAMAVRAALLVNGAVVRATTRLLERSGRVRSIRRRWRSLAHGPDAAAEGSAGGR